MQLVVARNIMRKCKSYADGDRESKFRMVQIYILLEITCFYSYCSSLCTNYPKKNHLFIKSRIKKAVFPIVFVGIDL